MIKLKHIDGPSGMYATYVKLSSRRGVKVYNDAFRTIQDAMLSDAWSDADREATLLKIAEPTGITPKCYGRQLVKCGKWYRIGIVMQHLGETCLAYMDYDDNEEWKITEDLNNQLGVVGLSHGDLHSENIMVKGKKFYVIDFTPDSIGTLKKIA